MSVRTYVRTSVHNQTQCTHINYICMDRGQWDKSNDIGFKVIQGQGQGHGGVKVAKMAIFKVYLLRHLWTEIEFDYGLWIYGTISKFHRAGFSNFAFVFELLEVKGHGICRFWQSSNGHYSVTSGRRVKLMVSLDRATIVLSSTTARSRTSRNTWRSRDSELSYFVENVKNRHFQSLTWMKCHCLVLSNFHWTR